MEAKKILFATDFSEASNHALNFATSLARDWDAKLLIVHVVEGDRYPQGRWFEDGPKPPPEEVAELDKVVPTDASVQCHRELLLGPPEADTVKPADEIVKYANQVNADAVVIGTHGRSGLAHLLMGSVAESVVRQAPCPVVTVKQPQ